MPTTLSHCTARRVLLTPFFVDSASLTTGVYAMQTLALCPRLLLSSVNGSMRCWQIYSNLSLVETRLMMGWYLAHRTPCSPA